MTRDSAEVYLGRAPTREIDVVRLVLADNPHEVDLAGVDGLGDGRHGIDHGVDHGTDHGTDNTHPVRLGNRTR